MINPNIPGEINREELEAIVTLAQLVPEGGTVVEVGSYKGLSSWHWAKHVPPSATVYCCDPWDGYRGSSLRLFRQNVRDCPNIVAMQGYSPGDFQSWSGTVDLYFEDAVHKNPILGQNIAFWSQFLSSQGIVCGHDFIGKFPDVISAARALASHERPGDLHVVNSLWVVLPREGTLATRRRIATCASELTSISRHRRGEENVRISPHDDPIGWRDSLELLSHEVVVTSPQPTQAIVQGQTLRCVGRVKNLTGIDLPVKLSDEIRLRVGGELHSSPGGQKVLSARREVEGDVFEAESEREFELQFQLGPHCLPGNYELKIDLVYERLFWFRTKGAQEKRVTVSIRSRDQPER